MERLGKEGAALVYRCAKQHSEPTSDKRGAKTTLAALALPVTAQAEPSTTGEDVIGAPSLGSVLSTQDEPVAELVPPKRPLTNLPVVGVDRPHLRSVPAAVSQVWRADASDCVHYPQHRYPANPGSHWG